MCSARRRQTVLGMLFQSWLGVEGLLYVCNVLLENQVSHLLYGFLNTVEKRSGIKERSTWQRPQGIDERYKVEHVHTTRARPRRINRAGGLVLPSQ